MGNRFVMSPEEALKKMIAGNERFLSGKVKHRVGDHWAQLEELVDGQTPFSTVLGCSDSRVPPELIFDAGFGDIFTCRNAGNTVNEVTLGSIEYAAVYTGCPLLIVMGHEGCGACIATITHYKNPHHHETHNVDDIVRRITPAVIESKHLVEDEWALVNEVARANVRRVCRHVLQGSPLLNGLVKEGKYGVIGAYYHISTGAVDFFPGFEAAI